MTLNENFERQNFAHLDEDKAIVESMSDEFPTG